MATIEVRLPRLLAQTVDEGDSFAIEAETVRDALAAIARHHTKLALHVFDESGELRQHVLCFHNETNTRWLESLDIPIGSGDSLTFMQAVSGG